MMYVHNPIQFREMLFELLYLNTTGCFFKKQVNGFFQVLYRIHKYKDSHPAWMKKYCEMAEQEMMHAENLFGMAVEATPHDMTEREKKWSDHLRKIYMEKAAHVKELLAMCKR